MAYEFASRLETFPNYRKFETTFAGRLVFLDQRR